MAGAGTMVRRFAPAKVNLYLHVLGRRPDGYHRLDSLVVFADVGDEVVAAPAPDGEPDLTLTVEGPFAGALAGGADNLVLRAARALAEAAGVAARARLTLVKNLPVAAGVGGGSADAAAALSALAGLWGLRLDDAALDRVALGLGADVPMCRRSRPLLVGGTGDELDEAPALPALALVLVNPGVPLATAAVFAAFDAGAAGGHAVARPLSNAPVNAAALAAELKRRANDLEGPARFLAPAVDAALAALAAAPGCLLARMSGSGATCFGLFADAGAARHAAAAIGRAQPAWWVVAAGLRPA